MNVSKATEYNSNHPNPRPLLTKRDLVLIMVALLAGLALLGVRHVRRKPAAIAEITSAFDTHIIHLDRDRIFSVQDMPNVIFEVRDGRIAFIESDCPDQICVHSGFLEMGGQMAACLPNNMLLILPHRNDDAVDIFVR